MVGLSAGIACTLLIYLWVHDEVSYDKFFENDSQVYQVMEHRKNSGSQGLTDESCGMVSEVLKVQNPEVLYAAAVAPADWYQKFTLSVADKNIKLPASMRVRITLTFSPLKCFMATRVRCLMLKIPS
jgi:putative ABC transport system permease protein